MTQRYLSCKLVKMRKFLILLVGFSVSLFAAPLVRAQEPRSSASRLIVKFKSSTPQALRDNVLRTAGPTSTEGLLLANAYVLNVPAQALPRVAQALSRNPLVEYTETDAVASAFEVPNDPYYSSQWGLAKIKAPGAWDVTHGAVSVDIAITDTGINKNHSDLSSKVVSGVDCTLIGCPAVYPTDRNGHGTHVAGIASAITNNSRGVAGLAWDGRLMSVKVLSNSGSGYYSWVANGIVWAADNGAEVINLSLGGSSSSKLLEDAVNYAWGKGVVVTAAAGNSNTSSPLYPAYYPNVIAVAATDKNDAKTSFSSWGSWVDVAAPGVSIFSTYKSSYKYLSGTSMSTPYVSGLAALVRAQNPGWSSGQVRDQIESTADAVPGTGTYWQWGRINACAAVGCTLP